MISIIIPVYNLCGNKSGGDNTLDVHRITSTLLSQKIDDFEILLCDDGSTDDTLEHCYRIANQDNRIRIISSKHAGVSSARNNGIKNARGEYVTFVDADDLILDNILSDFVDAVSQQPDCDLVRCGYAVIENSKTQLCTYSQHFYDGVDEIRGLIENTAFLYRCSPWAKLFKRRLLVDYNILFDEKLSHSEDRLFLYEYLLHTNSISTVPAISYLYGSISAMSLKHKPVSYDMLLYRQNAMSIAAHKVINRFNICPKRSFYIGNNLCNTLLIHAMTCVAYSHASKKLKAARQLEILKYQQTEFEYWMKDPRFAAAVKQNALLNALIANDIKRLNATIYKQKSILSLKLCVKGLLMRKSAETNTNTISNFLSYLN